MKKISWILLIVWLVLTYALSTNAMYHQNIGNGMWWAWMMWSGTMMWSMEMMKSCPTYKNMTDEEKLKFDSMTMTEKMSYMQSKMWSGTMMGKWWMMMWSWSNMWNWNMNSNSKSYVKLHNSLNKFYEKLDKEVTDNAKKIETLEKINTKIDTILLDSNLSETKKEIYNHIKYLIELKINEIETTDFDLDWLLQIN